MAKITILVVDDHQLIRESWVTVLNKNPRFRVIGQASSGNEAVKFARTNRPQIVIMDINMSPINGIDTTGMIRKCSPKSKVIGVSMHNMPSYARKMMDNGAMGYVTKSSSSAEMVSAIMDVNKGKKYVCTEVKNILCQQRLEDINDIPDLDILSKREKDIARFIKEGMSSKEIGALLFISLKTIEVHRYNILKKLSMKNTVDLVNFLNTQIF
jgi:DNA-binding NarL/FixJ family response regulator